MYIDFFFVFWDKGEAFYPIRYVKSVQQQQRTLEGV